MKILLIQLRRLGDLILTTPAISALREHLPAAQIALAVSGECAPLLPAIQGLRQTFLTKRGVRDLSAWMQMRHAGFDGVVYFTRNARSAWLTFLSGAPQRIVSDRLKIKSKIRLRFYNEFVDCAMKQMHTADYYLALLQPLGISATANDPLLELPAAAQQRASSVIADRICHQPARSLSGLIGRGHRARALARHYDPRKIAHHCARSFRATRSSQPGGINRTRPLAR